MHNGEITGFRQIKRALQQSLPEELFLYPSGYTDSEWAFMLFLSKLKDPHARKFTHTELKDAMMETIATFNRMLKAAGIVSPVTPVSRLTSRAKADAGRPGRACSTLSSAMATQWWLRDTSLPAPPKLPLSSFLPVPRSRSTKKAVFTA